MRIAKRAIDMKRALNRRCDASRIKAMRYSRDRAAVTLAVATRAPSPSSRSLILA